MIAVRDFKGRTRRWEEKERRRQGDTVIRSRSDDEAHAALPRYPVTLSPCHLVSLSPCLLLCLLILLPLCQSRSAWALPVARLRNVKPPVRVASRRAAIFTVARERKGLRYGDIVRTGPGGQADIIFSNGTRVEMREKSQIHIIAPQTPRQPLVILIAGALSEVFVRPRGNTQVRTAAAIAAARGTEFLVHLPTADTTVVTVVEGVVDFFNPQGNVVLNENQQSTARIGAPPTPPITVDASGLISWTAEISGLPVEFETPFISPDPALVEPLRAAGEAAVRATPNRAEAHARLGEIYHDLGEYAAAVAQFAEEVRLAPQSAASYARLGQARRGQGDIAASVVAYEHALRLAPDDNQTSLAIRTGLALTYLAGEDQQRARAILENLPDAARPVPASQTPSSANRAMAQAVLGLLELQEGRRNAKAAQHLTEATAQEPQLYQAYALLALVQLTRSQIPEAEQAARRAAQLQPNSAQAQGSLATVLFFSGQTKEATRAAQRAVALNPLSPFALLTQGRVLLAQLRTDEARDAYQQAAALAPRQSIIHSELGAVYFRLDQLEKAEQSYRRALEMSPNMAAAHTGLGFVLYARGRTQEAIMSHLMALGLDLNNATARANLADLYIREGRLEDAERQLEQAVTSQPEFGIVYARLAELLLLRQDLHKAQEYARRAVRLIPNSAIAQYQLGRVYLEQGRSIQAEQAFRQATILDRQFAAARFALGLARERAATGLFPSSSLSGATALGGASNLLSLQNFLTPGAELRTQAAIQDPTVVRTASRSYGDTQVASAAGEQGTRDLQLSHLREIGHRRGVLGLTVNHQETDGVRANADFESNRLSLVFGRKAKENPLGVYLLGQFERRDIGADIGENTSPFSAHTRRQDSQPRLLAGFNLQASERRRTRVLFQYIKPEIEIHDPVVGDRQTVDYNSANMEVRHDRQFGNKSLLSAGLAVGSRRRHTDALLAPFEPGESFMRNVQNVKLRSYQAYIRDEIKVNERLTVMGEIQLHRLSNDRISQVLLPTVQDPRTTIAETTVGLPNFIAAYQPNARSSLHFRARRLVGDIEDFRLLAPTDVFLFTYSGLPNLNLLERGRSLELEYDYTFRNASFVHLGVFDQRLASAGPAPTAPAPQARRGLRASYEGFINRDTTFFVNFNLINARDIELNQDVEQVPGRSGEVGVQYLNRQGWFLQPSVFYLGSRIRSRSARPQSSGTGVSRLGGVSLVSLRAGKRWGLRSVLFVEVNNLFDKNYVVLRDLQPGRRVRLGVTRRF